MSRDRAGFAVLDAWLQRQPEPAALVTLESPDHYWKPLASHLLRRDVPVAVVNPLAPKDFARSRQAGPRGIVSRRMGGLATESGVPP